MGEKVCGKNPFSRSPPAGQPAEAHISPTMSAIDIHTHAFPDELAPRAIAALESAADWQAVGDGTIDALLESMDAADIDVSAVCTIATRGEQTKGIFKWCKKLRRRHAGRIEPLPSVHPDTPRPGRWIQRIAKAGFAGIKLHPMYQDFAADESRMDEIYAAAAESGLIVTLHSGRDIAFDPSDDRASPKRLRRVADRFGKLKLICTHLGGWRAWDQVETHLLGSGVYLETSFSVGMLGPGRACELIRRHGYQRVLFGSDWPWNNQADQARLIEQLELTSRQKRAILWSNAARLLGY